MKRLIILKVLLLTTISLCHADLVWTRNDGWKAKGGVFEGWLGNAVHAETAVQVMNLAQSEQEKGRCAVKKGDKRKHYRAAKRWYCEVYKKCPSAILAPEAIYQTALIQIEECQYVPASKNFDKIIKDYPNYPKFNEVIQAKFEIASQLQRGERPYYWGVIRGFRDYKGAVEVFESIVTNAPFSEYAAMSLMNIADLSLERGNEEDAIDALERLKSDYPDSPLAPHAYLKLAETYASMIQGAAYDQGATQEAINYYEDFLILYPDHCDVNRAEKELPKVKNILAESKFYAGKFYYKRFNDPCAARVFYNEAITVNPNSHVAARARHELACIDRGVPAPKTPVDAVFGRRKKPSTPTYLSESFIAERETDEFLRETEISDTYDGLEEERESPPDCAPRPLNVDNQCCPVPDNLPANPSLH